jgi:hypothetical protein
MLIKEAEELTGGLSTPSKMPGFAYNLPARDCKAGSKLRKVAGSVCEKCYAMKGRYSFPLVQNALSKRLKLTKTKGWVDAMVFLITSKSLSKNTTYFRWHDSGDLQNTAHLGKICQICERTPHIQHWLPTREYQVVKKYAETHTMPENLTIRLSAHMVGQRPPKSTAFQGSSVSLKGQPLEGAYACPAAHQGNTCGTCRACWDSSIEHVSYPKH